MSLIGIAIAADAGRAEVVASSVHSKAMPCEACHIQLASAPAQTRCTPCHERIAPHSRWTGSIHQRAGLTCASCHKIHDKGSTETSTTRRLTRSSEAETCFACHPAIRHAQTQRSTHLFRDELKRAQVGCSGCHDVHGSAGGDALLAAASVNDVCYRCHDDLRGPFLWEHPPARENCANCHSAHGSNNPRLLTMRQPMLCQSCHAGDAHVTAPGGPRSIWEVNRSCANCHGRIHGSNHPSGVTLQR